MRWIILTIGIVLIGIYMAPKAYNIIKRGSKVTTSTENQNPDDTMFAVGVIKEDPFALAARANVDIQIYSLARMIASEAGTRNTVTKISVGWVAKNQAKKRGISISKLLTNGSNNPGYFSAQNTGGRYASTRQDPYEDDISIAIGIINGTYPDPTNGSIQFYSPAAQDTLYATGKAGYNKTADEIMASWSASGLEPVYVTGINPRTLTFFRKVG